MQHWKNKDSKDEVTYNVTKFFYALQVFECGRIILDRLGVSYERACMVIQSTISDPAIFDYKEQVDEKSKLYEQVDAISDSKEKIDAVSEAKAYTDYSFKNEFENMNVSRINRDNRINLDSRINSPICINSRIQIKFSDSTNF